MDEDAFYDEQAQAQDDWAAMQDSIRNRGVDGTFPLNIEME